MPWGPVFSSHAKLRTHGWSLLMPAELAQKGGTAPVLLGHWPAAGNPFSNLLLIPPAPCVPCGGPSGKYSRVESTPTAEVIYVDPFAGCWMHPRFPLAEHHRKRENWQEQTSLCVVCWATWDVPKVSTAS